MVEFTIADTKIKISFLFVAMLSLLSLLDTSGGIFLSVLFSLLHEMGHIVAIILCNGKIEELSFRSYGIAMRLSKNACLSFFQELFVLASGCAVNLAVLLFSKGTIHYINVGIFLFNILPIANLDGGRIMNMIFVQLFGERKGERTSAVLSFVMLLPLSVFGFYIAITAKQPTLLVCALYLATTLIIKREKLY